MIIFRMFYRDKKAIALGQSNLASAFALIFLCLISLAKLPPVYAQSDTGLSFQSNAGGGDLSTASDESPERKRARIRLELAAAYFGRNQLATALDEVKKSISLDSKYSEAFEMRGLIYDALNEPSYVEESFQRALQLNPRNGSAAHNLAWFFCRNKDYANANKFFERALNSATNISIAKILLARGVCQMQAGAWKDAEKSLKSSHEIDPSNPAVAFNLALVLYKQGDFERARFHARRVNNISERVTAESLWLGVRIENKLGNVAGRDELKTQLRSRFPASREVNALELGLYNE